MKFTKGKIVELDVLDHEYESNVDFDKERRNKQKGD